MKLVLVVADVDRLRLAGCNTVKGASDIEKGGEAIQRAVKMKAFTVLDGLVGAARPCKRRHRCHHPQTVPEVDQAQRFWSQRLR